jgi:hypothetical protein
MAGFSIDWASFWSHGRWALFLFVLPLGLLTTTHFVYRELHFANCSVMNLIKLAAAPYAVIWVCIDLAAMANYLPEQLTLVATGLALLVLFIAGPVFGKYVIRRTLKCSPDETNEFFKHWSLANLILFFLMAFALPHS